MSEILKRRQLIQGGGDGSLENCECGRPISSHRKTKFLMLIENREKQQKARKVIIERRKKSQKIKVRKECKKYINANTKYDINTRNYIKIYRVI